MQLHFCAARSKPTFPTRRSSDLSSRELARGRNDGLFLRNRLQELVLVVLDREDELADEGLVVFLPDRLVALREVVARSEEHTSELQSLRHLVCRLLLENKNKSTY